MLEQPPGLVELLCVDWTEDKEKGNFTNSRAIIDACRPFHWKDDFPPVNSPSRETMREAVEKWGYLCE